MWPYLEMWSLKKQSSQNEVIRVGPDSEWLGFFIKGGNLDTETDSYRGKMMWRQGRRQSYDWSDVSIYKPRNTKDYWQTPKSRRDKEWFSSRAIREGITLPIPWFQTSGLQNGETINFWFLVNGSLKKRIETNSVSHLTHSLWCWTFIYMPISSTRLLAYLCIPRV